MQTSQEKYGWLVTHHSELFQRVPAKYLASYLGITEVTLSKSYPIGGIAIIIRDSGSHLECVNYITYFKNYITLSDRNAHSFTSYWFKKISYLKIYIKYMVSSRCKMAVKVELRKLGLHFILVDLGEVEIMEDISADQREQIKIALHSLGLELMDDKRAVLMEKIKIIIIEMVHHTDNISNINFSVFLSEKLNHKYTYLANQFSEIQGTTIEQFIIDQKIERIKELIIYGKLNMTEIAWKMNYSSLAHLSTQFKKATGLSPSNFKQLRDMRQSPLEETGMPVITRITGKTKLTFTKAS